VYQGDSIIAASGISLMHSGSTLPPNITSQPTSGPSAPCLTLHFTSGDTVASTRTGWELVYYTTCAAGFYCPSPGSSIPCRPGSFCPIGSVAPVPCPRGSYCPSFGAQSPAPCPAGVTCSQVGMWNLEHAVTCSPFLSCPPGSIYPAGVHCSDISDNCWRSGQLEPQFNKHRHIASANRATSVRAADIDGDGHLDIVSASLTDGSIIWYRNDGQGSFSERYIVTSSAAGARSVFCIDIDHDGDQDVVVVAFDSDNLVAWYCNDGNGVFSDTLLISDTVAGSSVFAADVSGNGNVDVLVASLNADSIYLYSNDGTGSFSSAITITASADGVNSVVAADLNGDGALDIVSASINDNSVCWYINDGRGGFSSKIIISDTVKAASSVVAADIDGDGALDIVAASSSAGSVHWFRNLDGRGSFSTTRTVDDVAKGAWALFAADIDADGWVDIVCAVRDSNTVAYYRNNHGSFNSASKHIVADNVDGAWSVFVVDIDNDGDNDILSAAFNNFAITWHDNEAGGFASPTLVNDALSGIQSIAAGDLDQDGAIDTIFASPTSNTVVWHKNLGNGSFSLPATLTTAVVGVRSVIVWDLNNDRQLDVVCAGTSAIMLLRNLGGGIFASPYTIPDTVSGAHGIVVADMNHDDLADIVAVSGNSVSWHQNNGDLTFSTKHIIDYAPSIDGQAVFAADVNGDSHMDVVAAFNSDKTVVVWYNNGNGTFSTKQLIAGNIRDVSALWAADMDLDGHVDILVASRHSNVVSWHRNRGNGTFGSANIVSSTVRGVSSMFVIDMDSDSDFDVLSASAFDNTVLMHRNNGHGLFTETVVVSDSVSGVQSVYAVDLDGDGDMDPISAATNDGSVSFHRNNLRHSSQLEVSATEPTRTDCTAISAVPCSSIASALHAAQTRSAVSTRIHVAAGEYTALSPSVLEFGRRLIDIVIDPNGVSLLHKVSEERASASVRLLMPSLPLATHIVRGGTLTIDNQFTPTIRALEISTRSKLSTSDVTALRFETSVNIRNSAARRGHGGGMLVRSGLKVEFDHHVQMQNCSTHGHGQSGGCVAIMDSANVIFSNLSVTQCQSAHHGGGVLLRDLGSTVSMDSFEAYDTVAKNGCGGALSARATAFDTSGSSVLIRHAMIDSTATATIGDAFCVSTSTLSVNECAPSSAIRNGSYFATDLATMLLPSSCLRQLVSSDQPQSYIPRPEARCRTGTIMNTTGHLVCSQCSPGQYLNDDMTECTNCPTGRFAAEFGSMKCTECELGSVTPTVASVTCIECPAGRFHNVSSFSCTSCPLGRFTNSSSMTQCLNCAAGSITPTASSVTCVECPAGRFHNVSSFSCESCPVGSFTSISSQTKCIQCNSGSISPQAGSAQCLQCAAGRFQNTTSGQCESCLAGYYAASDGLTSCAACSRGTFSNIAGSVGCIDCPSGRFSNVNGSAQCSPCPANYFSSSPGLTSCTSCASMNLYSFANRTGAQFCDECSKQEYFVFSNLNVTSQHPRCQPCPSNADCSNGQPLAEPGYWVNIDAATGLALVFPCSTHDACPGGNTCGPNRLAPSQNPLCAACAPGYQEFGDDCIPCESTNAGAVFGVMFFVLILMQLFFFVSQGASAYVSVLSYFAQTAILFIGSQTNSGASTILSIFDLDVFAAAGSSTSCIMQMSDEVRSVSGFFGPLFAFVCWAILFALWVLINHYGCCASIQRRWANSMSTERNHESSPRQQEAVVPLPWCTCCSPRVQHRILWMLHSFFRLPTSPKHRQNDRWIAESLVPLSQSATTNMNIATRWMRTLLALFLLTFNGVTRTAFAVFNCIEVSVRGSTVRVIESYPSVNCDDPAYGAIATFATVICSVYFIVPVALIAAFPNTLLPIRHCLGRSHRWAKRPKPSADMLYVLGALAAPYRGHAAWWKLSVLIRRIVLVATVVFISSRGWRMVAASMICMFIFAAHVLSQPFLNRTDNAMETMSLFVLSLLSALLVHAQPPYNAGERDAIGVLWAIPFVMIVLWAVGGWIWYIGPFKRAMQIVVREKVTVATDSKPEHSFSSYQVELRGDIVRPSRAANLYATASPVTGRAHSGSGSMSDARCVDTTAARHGSEQHGAGVGPSAGSSANLMLMRDYGGSDAQVDHPEIELHSVEHSRMDSDAEV
jgi:FG-GAP-like repeat/Tyrosine-protein kinase ephrin type A/B receptor-like